jgi:hypothetical protein
MDLCLDDGAVHFTLCSHGHLINVMYYAMGKT